jgi:hypothetical protein
VEEKQLQWFHIVELTEGKSRRKDCGKIEEIRKFLSLNPYKMEMALQETFRLPNQ